MVIKRVGVLKLATIQACMGVAIGVFFAILFMLFGSLIASINPNAAAAGMAGGIAMLFILPIFYGVCGFIFGALAAWLYNIIAGMVGGIEIDVE
ncbi:MAG TPA: hypothetical protein VF132_05570 [Rudaea sp.]